MKQVLCALVLAAFAASGAWADTILVDLNGGGDHLTIQAGVDAASEGDTVLVAPGTYFGAGNYDIDFGGTNMVLASLAGADSTVIEVPTSTSDYAVTLSSGEDTTSVFRGFTCRTAGIFGAIILLTGTSGLHVGLTVEDCVLSKRGIRAYYGTVVVRRTYFDRCKTDGSAGGGMKCSYSTVMVEDSLFHGCGVGSLLSGFGSGIWLSFCDADLVGVRFEECVRSHSLYGTLFAEYSTVELEHATFWYNDSNQDIRVSHGSLDATNVTLTWCNTAIMTEYSASVSVENSIIAFNGTPFTGVAGSTITNSCIFGNGSDSLSCGHSENLFEDPLFCDLPDGVLTLEDCSPCLGAAVGGGDLGAWGAGCPCGDPTGVDVEPAALQLVSVSNPARETCRFLFYRAGRPADVTLTIYNIEGRTVAELTLPAQRNGLGSARWSCTDSSGRRVASGVYPYQISDGASTARGVVTVVR